MFRYYTRNCIALKIEMPIFCAKRSRSATQLYLFNITLFFKTHYTLCGFCFVKEIFLLNPTLSKFSDQSPIFCWKLSSVRLFLMHSNALSAIHSSFWSYFSWVNITETKSAWSIYQQPTIWYVLWLELTRA